MNLVSPDGKRITHSYDWPFQRMGWCVASYITRMETILASRFEFLKRDASIQDRERFTRFHDFLNETACFEYKHAVEVLKRWGETYQFTFLLIPIVPAPIEQQIAARKLVWNDIVHANTSLNHQYRELLALSIEWIATRGIEQFQGVQYSFWEAPEELKREFIAKEACIATLLKIVKMEKELLKIFKESTHSLMGRLQTRIDFSENTRMENNSLPEFIWKKRLKTFFNEIKLIHEKEFQKALLNQKIQFYSPLLVLTLILGLAIWLESGADT